VKFAANFEAKLEVLYKSALVEYDRLLTNHAPEDAAAFIAKSRDLAGQVVSAYAAWTYPSVPARWLTDFAAKIGVGILAPGGALERSVDAWVRKEFPEAFAIAKHAELMAKLSVIDTVQAQVAALELVIGKVAGKQVAQ
jgi:hypothetical protein